MKFNSLATKSLTVCAALSLALVGCGGQAQTSTTEQKSEEQVTRSADEEATASADYVDEDVAIAAARAYIAGVNDISDAKAELVEGGDAPHYVVTFHFDDADYTVEVDALTGKVWSATDSYGTTYDEPYKENDSYITSEEAIKTASAYIAGENNVSNAEAELVEGGDAPHYVVTFHFDDADYTVEVDALTGDVWSATDSYGTTYDEPYQVND